MRRLAAVLDDVGPAVAAADVRSVTGLLALGVDLTERRARAAGQSGAGGRAGRGDAESAPAGGRERGGAVAGGPAAADADHRGARSTARAGGASGRGRQPAQT